MNRTNIIVGLYVIIIALPGILPAMDSWTSAELDIKFNKVWVLEAEQELRIKDKFSAIDEYFTQLYIGYRFIKGFEVGGALRYIQNNDTKGKEQGYESHFRFHFDLSYKHKLERLSLRYRLRYQNSNELGKSPMHGDHPDQHIRVRTRISYNLRKWKLDPIVAVELFYHIERGYDREFDKYRLTLGTQYKIKKFGRIGLFYRFERRLNQTNPEPRHIVMTKYRYEIK